jgi:hypothetical protein
MVKRKANRYRFCKAATEEPAKESAVGKVLLLLK